jgi:hypothetical protein
MLNYSHFTAMENMTHENVTAQGQMIESSTSPGPNSGGFFAQAHHFNISDAEFTFVHVNQYKVSWEQKKIIV